MLRKFRYSSAAVLTLLLVLVCSQTALAGMIQSAPLNPEFLEYQRQIGQKRTGPTALSGGEKKYPLGYIPAPLDLSHVTPPKDLFLRDRGDGALPSTYDLRDHSALTAVRDQNPYGTCWAFGTLASLESTFRKSTGEVFDFSEWHLAYFGYVDEKAGFPAFTRRAPSFGTDPIFDQGGNRRQATAILARWTGAVKEEDRPYNGPLPTRQDPAFKHLENVWYLGGTLDGNTIKRALLSHGAVSVSLKWNNAYFSETYNSFYRPNIAYDGGHCVTIVGWNDAYDRTKFNNTAPQNGAWLVKNSWGSAWGDSGFFWLSYSDPNLSEPALFTGGDRTNFTRNYQYDPLGWVTSYYFYGASTTGWCANIFSARGSTDGTSAELLKAFSFYAGAAGTSYRAEVRTGVDANSPGGGNLALVKEGTLAAAGYHTVEISPVHVNKGERFSIILRVTTPGFNYPIPVEYPVKDYTDKATSSRGESFISSDGESWDDLITKVAKSNVCIKAFSSDMKKPEKPQLSAPAEGAVEVNLPVLLKTASFVPGRDGGIHKSTLWQIGRTYDFSGTLALDEESPSLLTNREVGWESLAAGTKYYWRVRFKDSNGALSDWSDARSFTTSTSTPSSSGGGCSALSLTPFVFGLLVPLFLLRRR